LAGAEWFRRGKETTVKISKPILGLVLISGLLAGSMLPGVAFADPPEGGNASCQGYEGSSVSPVGSEDGPYSQFGMPGIILFIDEFAIPAFDAKNRGGIISFFSKLHEGSHHDCDEAAGIPEGGE
jgi:hypothetical protein